MRHVDDSYEELARRESDGAAAPPSKAQISQVMAVLGRRGGKIGGKRRLETMTAEQRRKIAKKAAQARWAREEV